MNILPGTLCQSLSALFCNVISSSLVGGETSFGLRGSETASSFTLRGVAGVVALDKSSTTKMLTSRWSEEVDGKRSGSKKYRKLF